MKPSKIYEIMNVARRARKNGDIYNPCFVGAPGLGKTEIIQQWCVENNLPFIIITSPFYEAPDIKGFPIVQVVHGRQRQTYATPDFWPDEGEGVIILEEMNRGQTSVMNCWMSLTDKRRGFDGYKLPEGWLVAACINPEDGYDTNTMDPALKDRFEIFNVTYDRATHLDYMKATNWHPDIINFIEAGYWTYREPSDNLPPGTKYTSPRTWSKVNTALKAGFHRDDELLLLEPELGINTAKDFYNFRYNETPVMYHDLVKDTKKALKKLEQYSTPPNVKSGMISLTCKDILADGTITDELLEEVLLVLPADQGAILARELENNRKDYDLFPRLFKRNKKLQKLYKDTMNAK